MIQHRHQILRNKKTSSPLAMTTFRQEAEGFVIYRTIYTLESDLIWSSAIEKLNRYIAREKCVHTGCDTEAVRCNHSCNNVIPSDPTLYRDKSTDDIAEIFAEYIDSGPLSEKPRGIRPEICLMIDEEVLSWLRDAPEPMPLGTPVPEVCIKTIDIEWDPDDEEEELVHERYQS